MSKYSKPQHRPRDFWPTPAEAVEPLLRHIEYGATFVEPCAGDGSLVRHLQTGGLSCVWASDIEPQAAGIAKRDALQGVAHVCRRADYIITNPPWTRSVLHPMISAFRMARPTWLLFQADWWHTKQAEEFAPYCEKIVPVGRVRWVPGSADKSKENAAWYLFRRRPVPFTILAPRVS